MKKFYVVEFSAKGKKYKRYKCIDGFVKTKDNCWQFSKQGAKKIADRLNEWAYRNRPRILVGGVVERRDPEFRYDIEEVN